MEAQRTRLGKVRDEHEPKESVIDTISAKDPFLRSTD
jgi:hypothetical protein